MSVYYLVRNLFRVIIVKKKNLNARQIDSARAYIPDQHKLVLCQMYIYAKTKGNTLVHREYTSMFSNHYQTLHVKCTLLCTPSALTVTFGLGTTVKLKNIKAGNKTGCKKC